ncbi:hypothetical protein LCGC14_0500970 [marine sediment metagenome]|uniref:Uncharacterized protein n=1 Tax=marine sediment metagenome TaxID=412755 RepID=A0A0F9SMB4_9ZZZZ|nr:hypothetical protein [Candidatus Aminicenantes bacterium]
MIDQPDGIIITISQGMLKEKGLRNWLRNFFEAMDNEDLSYWMRQGTKPKRDFLYVYLCIGGKVRYRANYVGAYGPGEMTFTTGETMFGKAWVVISGPLVRAPWPFPMKGFRGFRYTEFLF